MITVTDSEYCHISMSTILVINSSDKILRLPALPLSKTIKLTFPDLCLGNKIAVDCL